MNQSKKYLIVKGTCGLGNRLMTLANALEYCEKTGRTISVDWSDGMFSPKGENAFTKYFVLRGCKWESNFKVDNNYNGTLYPDVARNLPDTFELDEYFHTCSANKKGSKLLSRLIHFGSGVAHTLLSEDCFKYYFVLWNHWELLESHRDLRSPKLGGNMFCLGGDLPLSRREDIVYFGDFCPSYQPKYLRDKIFLKDDLRNEIDIFAKENNIRDKTLGLHIRCTDKNFKENLQKIFYVADNYINKYKLKNIFLSTDQYEIIKHATKFFGSKLVLYNKYLPHLENGGKYGIHTWALGQEDEQLKVQMYHDALMEMYLLAETEYLLYQGNSTFSSVSCDISKSEMCFDWQKCL